MRYEIYIRQKKKPESYYIGAMEEYKKRLSSDCKLQYHFIRKDKEWEKILSETIDGRNILFRVRPGKAEITSEEFARRTGDWERKAARSVVFFLDAEDRTYPEEVDTLSISCFTMPVGMSAMILLEQLYRSFRIRNNQPYHK